MLSVQKIRELVMAKNAAGGGGPPGNMVDRMEGVLAAMPQPVPGQAPVVARAAIGGGGGGKSKDNVHNSYCVKGTIINYEVTKTSNNQDMTTYTLLVRDTGDFPINQLNGYRKNGVLYLNIWSEQPFNDGELAEYIAELDKRGVKSGHGSRKRKYRKEFLNETADLVPGFLPPIKVFGPPFTNGKGVVFPKGMDVIISGIEPSMKLNKTEDGSKGLPTYGLQWNIGQLFADPKGGSANLIETWTKQQATNAIPNLYQGVDGGYSPTNITPEEQELIATWDAEGTLSKNNYKVAHFNLAQSERPKARGGLYIPLGQNAGYGGYSPFEVAQRNAVKFESINFGEVWAEFPKEGTPTAEMTVELVTKIMKLGVATEKVFVRVYMSSKILETSFFRFGIVDTVRWSKVAPAYMPYVSGFLVTKLSIPASLGLPMNQPLLNGRDEAGNPEIQDGYHFGAHYTATYVDPDLASIITAPTAFEITLRCAKFLIQLVLGTDNPSSIGSEFAKIAPLLVGLKKVINMFECQENPDTLHQNGYKFFFVYPLAKVSERRSVESIRKHIAAKKIDPVEQFSALFMKPPQGEEELFHGEDAIFNHMPLPDLDKTDGYVVFAIRKEEVERVLKGPVEPSGDEFLAEIARIEKLEEAKFGPLPVPPVKPLAIMPPPQQLALAAPEPVVAPVAPANGKRTITKADEPAPATTKREIPQKGRKKTVAPPPVVEEEPQVEEEDVSNLD
jgi:hypothetical protein